LVEKGYGSIGGGKRDDSNSLKETPWDTYGGIVSPGDQPFEFNVLTLIHAYLVSAVVGIYMVASLIFVPLVIVFGVFLFPVVFTITFVVMYIPMQLASGRLFRCLCPLLMFTRCCQPKKGQHAATSEIAGRVDLMALKAMGTIFFTLFAASVYFTPFYFGGEDGGWLVLIDNLVNMPEFDVLNMLTLFQSIKLIFTLPSWDVTFVVPATITLGVLALQYSTEFVRWYFNRYLKNYKITAAHFRLPLMPVIAVFALGIYVQTGFLLVWDLLMGCFGCWTCQLPGFLCSALAGCLDDVKEVWYGSFGYPL